MIRTRLISCLILALAAFAPTSYASVIAVVDSGTALDHKDLVGKAWTNPQEMTEDAVDNDWNGFVDDIHGWNFAENNRHLYDQKLVGTFSRDVYKFFELQLKGLRGTISEEEKKWVKEHREDPVFLKELMTFGNFVHGTHVAGIAAHEATDARIMPLKIIPTKAQGIFRLAIEENNDLALKSVDPKDFLIKAGLRAIASAQAKNMKPVTKYLKTKKARIANCSFGSSAPALAGVLKQLLKAVYRREPTDEELKKYVSYLMDEILKQGEAFAKNAPDTFFVIAAGNDGTNNEVSTVFPANLRLPNTITVAATQGLQKLASFSNYGPKFVDVAAPGVGIISSIPGNEMLPFSGTSQASPYVANALGRIFDANPALTHAQAREILMKTVDFKDYLKGKVGAEGVVNTARAVHAATLSRTEGVASALTEARMQVVDMAEATGTEKLQQWPEITIPMPPLVK